ncbi:hypothetical protein OY671_011144, partial [Metschnikowia pulcherrima]
GADPLEHFGKHAATHLARNSAFKNAPDIYVVSMFDHESGEVAAFEELVGSHGGLGGTQSEPFALVPSEWSQAPDEIIVRMSNQSSMFEAEPEPEGRDWGVLGTMAGWSWLILVCAAALASIVAILIESKFVVIPSSSALSISSV